MPSCADAVGGYGAFADAGRALLAAQFDPKRRQKRGAAVVMKLEVLYRPRARSIIAWQ